MKRWLFTVLMLLVCSFSFAQSDLRFEENKGQWDERVRYMARMAGGYLFVQDDGLLFVYQTPHSHTHFDTCAHSHAIGKHSFFVQPIGMRHSKPECGERMQGYSNYFLGNDPSKWQSRVPAYSSIVYREVYKGVDWRIYSSEGEIKHEFIVKPDADPQIIELAYRGVENIKLIGGELHLQLSVGTVIEQRPYAYQVSENRDAVSVTQNSLSENQMTEVEIAFLRTANGIGYKVGQYDRTKPLVIDPSLVFSTYSGSTADNWGFTAAYDSHGNLYAGSIVNATGYPTSLGAWSDNFVGVWDCAITKFSADGTQLIYSTYLGGTYSEMPHSMIVNQYDELVVFGTTGSHDFPTTEGAYSRWFQGGSAVTYDGSVQFPNGVDIYVSRFSTDGTQLTASTYIGGSGNDGLNYRERYNSSQILTYLGNDSLYANYGDGARGELITDDRNNIYVGSSTFSEDFPVTPNAFQSVNNGGQEGIVFKLDYTLGSLLFSSYLGGGEDDAVFSIDTDRDYKLYVTGGTVSSDFPTSASAYSSSHSGGAVDAFLALVSYDGSSLLHSSYFGSSEFDLSYFVRTDRYGYPHIFGQTKADGATLVHNAQYAIPNSGQFIAKFSPQIDTLVFSTVFGTGDGKINISPTGFAVDLCGRIYASGWGRLFKYLPNLLPIFGTKNMEVTPDAYQTQTDGQDFYILSLSSDASVLEYATFFGELGTTTTDGNDHVDGGTSRFDKMSNLYQVVCASCRGTQGFPIAPEDAWSTVNGSSNCNAAAFKFNVHSDFAVADFRLPDFVCYPDSVRLENLGRGDNFLWQFGDGTTSTELNPVHHYTQSGTYDITLIAYKEEGCKASDTLTKRIILLDSQVDTLETLSVCPEELIQIGISSFPQSQVAFQWIPSAGLSSPNVPNPYASITETTTYRLVVTTPACSDTLIQRVEIRNLEIDLPDTVNYCDSPYELLLSESLPDTYSLVASWQRDFSDSLNVANRRIILPSAQSSWLYIHLEEGNCEGLDSVFMNYNGGTLQIEAHPTLCNSGTDGYAVAICSNFTPPLNYVWSNGESGAGLDSLGNLSVGNYTLTITDANGCSITQGFEITSPDDLIAAPTHQDNACQNQCQASITLNASGGIAPYSVVWSNGGVGETLSELCSGEYVYTLTDSQGCLLTDTVTIVDLDTLKLSLNATTNHCPEGCGAVVTSNLTGGTLPYQFAWSNGATTPTLTEVCNGEYSVEVTDANNCRTNGSVEVTFTESFENFWLTASSQRVFDGQEILLAATPIEGMYYSWEPSDNLSSPFSPSTIATMYQSTVFYVYATDNHGCNLKDSIAVEVDYVNCGRPNISVPNVFTPNGDGVNDKVFVRGEWIESFSFEIFDRWGEKVFATDSLQEGWDGTFNGRVCDVAVYFYKLEVHCQGGKTFVEGGDITLIR